MFDPKKEIKWLTFKNKLLKKIISFGHFVQILLIMCSWSNEIET